MPPPSIMRCAVIAFSLAFGVMASGVCGQGSGSNLILTPQSPNANGFAFAECLDEQFLFVAETSVSQPGVTFRMLSLDDAESSWSAPEARVVNPASSGLEPTVVIENEGEDDALESEFVVPGDQTSLVIPGDLVTPGATYKVEIIVQEEESGNRTITETGEFDIAE